MQQDKWDFYKDNNKEWRWRRTVTNGKIVGASSESYKQQADAVSNAEHYGYNGKFNAAGKWEFYQDGRSRWRWRHKAGNGKIIGKSSQGYVEKKDCQHNAQAHGYKG